MSQNRADEYRLKAQECVASAERTTNPNDKAAWLKMAENWQNLAQSISPPLIQVPLAFLANQDPEIPN